MTFLRFCYTQTWLKKVDFNRINWLLGGGFTFWGPPCIAKPPKSSNALYGAMSVYARLYVVHAWTVRYDGTQIIQCPMCREGRRPWVALFSSRDLRRDDWLPLTVMDWVIICLSDCFIDWWTDLFSMFCKTSLAEQPLLTPPEACSLSAFLFASFAFVIQFARFNFKYITDRIA